MTAESHSGASDLAANGMDLALGTNLVLGTGRVFHAITLSVLSLRFKLTAVWLRPCGALAIGDAAAS
jgi:hypothetical protein